MTAQQYHSGPIGVLVVHGIGAQEPGDTLREIVAGLGRFDHGFDEAGALAGRSVTIGGQAVRFYEVYWADLLKDERTVGAFQIMRFLMVAWFPLLNWCRGNYRKGDYSRLKILWWAVFLPIAHFLMYLGYLGGRLVAQFWGRMRRRKEMDKPGLKDRFAAMLRKAAARSTDYTILDELLDEYAGDVFSYVYSAGDAFESEEGKPDVPEEVRQVQGHILRRFQERLLQAQADGCDAVQVVAHSLGSVVTFHALAGHGTAPSTETEREALQAAMAKVANVYTIGSPLEKIRFFWPKIAANAPETHNLDFTWENFVSYFDPVAGRLIRFDAWGKVRNHHLLGGGFVSGHVVYQHSPVFLGALVHGICGQDFRMNRTRRQRFRDAMMLAGETLATPLAIGFLLILGAALFLLTASLLPWLMARPFVLFVDSAWLGRIQDVATLIVLGFMAFSMLMGPLVRATGHHKAKWLVPRD